jgi:haloalkane dehalogenase
MRVFEPDSGDEPLNFIEPPAEELQYLRPDPLLVEQELDVRRDVAEAIERAVGRRAGRVYWRSNHDYLYALELGDLGRGRPSLATVYGFWDRFEPRPPEHEIDADLLDLCLWAATAGSLNPADVARVAQHANIRTSWREGSTLRTPEDRFQNIPDFPYEPRYVDIEGLRMAYVETGSGDPILMLHGEPTWAYLYRHMIPPMGRAGRVIAPDLVGFGRSDKPVAANAYSYRSHARWLRKFIEEMDLQRITMVCQDWGGLLGLRVLSQLPERFARVVAMNTGIGPGGPPGEAFLRWRRFALRAESLDIGRLMNATLVNHKLTDAEAAAYNAPFPSKEYQTGALVFPRLVPIRYDHPGAYDNRAAIGRLRELDLPALLVWGKQDAITAPAEAHLRSIFRNLGETVWVNAGHFIQEDAGPEAAEHILAWMSRGAGVQ